MNIEQFKTRFCQRVEQLIDIELPPISMQPYDLHEAMRYSALNPGKRTRPLLAYATALMCGGKEEQVDAAAMALELIHAYSLIHDDLPCMDDDDLRRGLPTCHIKFGEALAVLAGDALQTIAFKKLSHLNPLLQPLSQLKIIELIAQSSGSLGMGGGQAIDLAATGKDVTLEQLEHMHLMKTGALINASVLAGYYSATSNNAINQDHVESLNKYSRAIGLAFQIKDDILDIESDTETLGKPQGSDLEANKSTYPKLLGLDGAKEHAEKQLNLALEALQELPYNTALLEAFAKDIVARVK